MRMVVPGKRRIEPERQLPVRGPNRPCLAEPHIPFDPVKRQSAPRRFERVAVGREAKLQVRPILRERNIAGKFVTQGPSVFLTGANLVC